MAAPRSHPWRRPVCDPFNQAVRQRMGSPSLDAAGL